MLGPEGDIRDVRIAVVHCLLVGYLVGAILAVRQGARRTVAALGPVLDLTRTELDEAQATAGSYPPRPLIIAAVIGVAATMATPYLVPPVPDAIWVPSAWSPEVAWHRTLGLVLGVLLAWFGYALIKESRRVSSLADSLKPIDLLDLRPLSPFTRLGLRSALLAVGTLAITSLFLLESGFTVLLVIIGTATLIVAALALLLPVHGAHLRIRATKEAELAWSRDGIRAARGDLVGGHGGERGELADLAAYHALIAGAPEWPFDLSTYVRFILYLLLPLAAWLTGALAEGWVQTAFAGFL